MGLAVRTDLVVSRTDDAAAVDADRRVRLEHGCGLGLAAVAHRTPGVWRSHGMRVPRAAESVFAVAAARPANRHAREAAGPAAGYRRACVVVPGTGTGGAAAHPSRVDSAREDWSAE